MIATMNGKSSFLIWTPKGSYIYNPRLKSGVKRNPCTMVWRLICALTNKMTNHFYQLAKHAMQSPLDVIKKTQYRFRLMSQVFMTPEGSNLNNPRLKSGATDPAALRAAQPRSGAGGAAAGMGRCTRRLNPARRASPAPAIARWRAP